MKGEGRLASVSGLFRLNQTNQTNHTDQMNQIDRPPTRREMVPDYDARRRMLNPKGIWNDLLCGQIVNHCLNFLYRFRRSHVSHSSQTFPIFHILIRFFCPIFRVESNTFVIF